MHTFVHIKGNMMKKKTVLLEDMKRGPIGPLHCLAFVNHYLEW